MFLVNGAVTAFYENGTITHHVANSDPKEQVPSATLLVRRHSTTAAKRWPLEPCSRRLQRKRQRGWMTRPSLTRWPSSIGPTDEKGPGCALREWVSPVKHLRLDGECPVRHGRNPVRRGPFHWGRGHQWCRGLHRLS